MTGADVAEAEELNVPLPAAITWKNIETEADEIKSIRLSSEMCGLYIDMELCINFWHWPIR